MPSSIRRRYFCFVPVGNVVLTRAVSFTFALGDVTLVSRDRLKRSPTLRTQAQLAELHSHPRMRDHVLRANTFAVLWHTGRALDFRRDIYPRVKNALSLLASSLLNVGRPESAFIGFPSEHDAIRIEFFVASTGSHGPRFGWINSRVPQELILDGQWKRIQTKFCYLRLLRIIHGDSPASPQWRGMLRRALMLVGRSMNSKDLGKAFLLDMIALELLITRPHERTSDVMPLRLEALLGWISFWKAEGYDTRIQDLCAKRNNLVHEGDVSRITLSDLKLADDLLQNLFVNVARNIRLFKSREDIIRLAERVQAERLLGNKIRSRPKTLRFIRRG